MSGKTCTRCGEAKPATREFFGSTPSGGLRSYCRNCMNKVSATYEEKNKDARRERDKKRAESLGGIRRGSDPRAKQDLFKKQNGLCLCCFRPIDKAENGEIDHVDPLSRNGLDVAANLLLAHAQCNREKHNKT
ncbi:hypothetical protein EN780_36700, partial [Mesorhizobium sp. M4B.F.Ca.ET.089.01.1.1]